jgi:hypothetical protein
MFRNVWALRKLSGASGFESQKRWCARRFLPCEPTPIMQMKYADDRNGHYVSSLRWLLLSLYYDIAAEDYTETLLSRVF